MTIDFFSHENYVKLKPIELIIEEQLVKIHLYTSVSLYSWSSTEIDVSTFNKDLSGRDIKINHWTEVTLTLDPVEKYCSCLNKTNVFSLIFLVFKYFFCIWSINFRLNHLWSKKSTGSCVIGIKEQLKNCSDDCLIYFNNRSTWQKKHQNKWQKLSWYNM